MEAKTKKTLAIFGIIYVFLAILIGLFFMVFADQQRVAKCIQADDTMIKANNGFEVNQTMYCMGWNNYKSNKCNDIGSKPLTNESIGFNDRYCD